MWISAYPTSAVLLRNKLHLLPRGRWNTLTLFVMYWKSSLPNLPTLWPRQVLGAESPTFITADSVEMCPELQLQKERDCYKYVKSIFELGRMIFYCEFNWWNCETPYTWPDYFLFIYDYYVEDYYTSLHQYSSIVNVDGVRCGKKLIVFVLLYIDRAYGRPFWGPIFTIGGLWEAIKQVWKVFTLHEVHSYATLTSLLPFMWRSSRPPSKWAHQGTVLNSTGCIDSWDTEITNSLNWQMSNSSFR